MYVQAAMAVMVVETPILGKTNVGTGIYTRTMSIQDYLPSKQNY